MYKCFSLLLRILRQFELKIEETELKKADRTVGVNCNKFSNISSGTA